MFKNILFGLTWFLAGLTVAVSVAPKAQPYIGGAIGYSKGYFPKTDNEGCPECATTYDQSRVGYQGMLFVGYQHKNLAFEVGAGSLSSYSCHNVGTLHTTGPYNIRQEISTSMIFARGIVSLPVSGRLQPFASLGLARVTMKNHEYGYNDPSLKFVEQLNYDTRTRPLLGVGLRYALDERVALRAELTYITHIAVSHWTAEHNVRAVWLGISTKF